MLPEQNLLVESLLIKLINMYISIYINIPALKSLSNIAFLPTKYLAQGENISKN